MIPSGLGKLQTEKSIENAMNEIRRWLDYIGVNKAQVDLSYSAALNIATCMFSYNGKSYEFRSTRQKNCRLNMHAIARAMEYKARLHVLGIEEFGIAMSPYLKLEGAQGQSAPQGHAPAPHSGSAYAVLGISELASNEELKLCYKRMVKAYHPDMAISPEAKEEFGKRLAEINGAWDKIKKERGIE